MIRGNVATEISVDDVTFGNVQLPMLEVVDVASGTAYRSTPNFTGAGWQTATVFVPKTGNNIEINLRAGSAHGWIVYDNTRIE